MRFRQLNRSVRWLLVAVLVVALAGGVYVLSEAASLTSAWKSIERVPLAADTTTNDPDGTSVTGDAAETTSDTGDETADSQGGDTTPVTTLPSRSTFAPSTGEEVRGTGNSPSSTSTTVASTTTTAENPASTILEQAPEPPQVVVLVGSDSRSGLDDLSDFGEFGGRRADVIVLAIRSGEQVTLLSVPRDLYVPDSCRGGMHRINAAFAGCGDQHGLTTLVHELEEVTGLDIDHAAAADLAGFQAVIDALGGYEICTDHAMRDTRSGLELDAGCTRADGETTLQWVRSRYTEIRVDGAWQTVSGISDLTRNERQRQLLMDTFDRLTDRSDPLAIRDALKEAAPHLTIDDELSLTDVAAWTWMLRDAEVRDAEIPVRRETTSGGASVLVPTVDVAEYVADLS